MGSTPAFACFRSDRRGTSDFVPPNVKPVEADVTDHLRGPFHHITMSSAIALARMLVFCRRTAKPMRSRMTVRSA